MYAHTHINGVCYVFAESEEAEGRW